MEIRTLKPHEIECRAQQVKQNGCVILVYKDARVDMRILDEVFGNENWQRTHEVINGNLFCNVEIWDKEKSCWIKKQDVGVESNTEAQKGEASDAFKRACFNVGIGRELYTAPFIWIALNQNEVYNKGDKYYLAPGVKFSVSQISYDSDRNIDKLVIIDNKKAVRYEMGKKTDIPKEKSISQAEIEFETALKELNGCLSISELQIVWVKYKKYQENKKFLEAKETLKTKLQ